MHTMDIIYTNTQDRSEEIVVLESGSTLGDLLETKGLNIDEVIVVLRVGDSPEPVSDPEIVLRQGHKISISSMGTKGNL